MSEIDAVILWVDGNDPVLSEKRARYAGDFERGRDDLAAPTRFASVGEIHWCVRSINRFAPWIRKIWIVTDGQDPRVESGIPCEVVDHKVLYRGCESSLPVFNSISIESMIWRIPGLSEKFIYFNDDLALAAPCTEEDFFTEDGKVVFYGKIVPTLWIRLLRDLKPKVDGKRRTTVKHSLLKTVDLAVRIVPRMSSSMGKAWPLRLAFPFPEHTPKALLKSFFEHCSKHSPGTLERNASFRFRDLEQFRADALFYMVLLAAGRCDMRSPGRVFFYYKPHRGEDAARHFKKKFSRLSGTDRVKFLCFNSLDQACPEVLQMVREWMEKRLI